MDHICNPLHRPLLLYCLILQVINSCSFKFIVNKNIRLKNIEKLVFILSRLSGSVGNFCPCLSRLNQLYWSLQIMLTFLNLVSFVKVVNINS